MRDSSTVGLQTPIDRVQLLIFSGSHHMIALKPVTYQSACQIRITYKLNLWCHYRLTGLICPSPVLIKPSDNHSTLQRRIGWEDH